MQSQLVPLTNEEKSCIGISFVLFVFGYFVAAHTCPSMLPKFGGIIICIGVIFGMRGIADKLDAAKDIAIERLNKPQQTIEALHAEGKIDQDTRVKLTQEIKENGEFISRLNFSMKLRLLKIEGATIVLGTLINSWGEYLIYPFNINC